MRILVLGVSTRAIAESAVRSGQPIVTVDYFGDRDQKHLVENYSLLSDLHLPRHAQGLAEAAGRVTADAVVYIGNLENHPGIVDGLGRSRKLLGNGPEVLREVRDWKVLRRFCRETGIACPTTLLPGEEGEALRGGRWLSKLVRSGGGHGIRPWDGKSLDESHILQAETEGLPASVAFVADGREARVVGLTEQLHGRAELGASGFTWCGNILPLDPTLSDGGVLRRRVERMVAALTLRFGLRGVNGADFIVHRETDGSLHPYLLEVNPRYCASMQLVEQAYGVNVFSLHLEGMAGRLPHLSPVEQPAAGFWGAGIVYARRKVVAPDTDGWIQRGIRDVPFEGDHIEAGRPICTVFARGGDRYGCFRNLVLRAAAVNREISQGREAKRERAAYLDHRTHA
ncbi:MAG: ATP-grasp domain-containing protein [bacterium]